VSPRNRVSQRLAAGDATALDRAGILPEPELPEAQALIDAGRKLARDMRVGDTPFFAHYGVASESEYKRQRMIDAPIMFHAQVGYRDLEQSRRACAEIYERLSSDGYSVDRYGICLDWSMGYPEGQRRGRPRGTGLILGEASDFVRLTEVAPVAPHFGDFVIGMPGAVENTAAALAAGATAIGNLGQYFTFRLPHWDDDVATTAATLTAMALAAAQPVPVLIHSNLDDGFAALFTDLSCALGAVLIEKYIVEELIGGEISHCYGHTYSDPTARLAFLFAISSTSSTPGTMIYGNTTSYGIDSAANYASLASYLLVDAFAQTVSPTGHAINPVPVTEASRIPNIDEIVDAHRFAQRWVERFHALQPMLDADAAQQMAPRIVSAGKKFKANVLHGLAEHGIDIGNPLELLLALRRIGPQRLEKKYGPGNADATYPRGRTPVVASTTIQELEHRAEQCVAQLDADAQKRLRDAGLVACVGTSDVHEYGKVLVEAVLRRLNVTIVDAGVSTDADALVVTAEQARADFVALSTYNGIALDYLRELRSEMQHRTYSVPVYIGGKLNQIVPGNQNDLPVDVSEELVSIGAIVCVRVEDMLHHLINSVIEEPPQK